MCIRLLGSDEAQKCCEDCVASLCFEARRASTRFVIHVTRILPKHVHYSCLEIVLFFPWSCFGIKRRIIIHTNVCFIIVHYNSLLSTHTCLGKHGRVYGDGFPGVRRWWFCVTTSTVKPSQPDSGLSTWSPQKRTQYKVVFLVLRRQQVYKCWDLMGTELLEAASGVSFWHHVEQSQRAQG